MKHLILAAVWLICLANAFFFGDIIVNYLLGNTQSKITDATTEQSQAIFSMVMLVIIGIILYFYTNLIKNNVKW